MLFTNHQPVPLPSLTLESELRRIAKVQGKSSHDELRFACAFFFEVYEEYLSHKVEPDIAFIRIFKKWCGQYRTQIHIMEELQLCSAPLIQYLVGLSHREDETWSKAIQEHVAKQIYAVTGN